MIILDNLHLEYTIRNNENNGTSGLRVTYSHESISRDLFQSVLEQILFSTTIATANKNNDTLPKSDITAPAPAAKPVKIVRAPVGKPPIFTAGQKIRIVKKGKNTDVGEVGTVVDTSGPNILVKFGTDDGRWARRRNCEAVPDPDKPIAAGGEERAPIQTA